VTVRLVDTPFAGYMRLARYALGEGAARREVPVLSGPGHDVALVAALTLDAAGHPVVVLKGGDTRPPRALRGEPYVKLGCIGGRLDHPGMAAAAIAALEVEEEVAGRVVDGGTLELGAPVPTMPDESTEADRPAACVVALEPGAAPAGDGGGMELAGLLRPIWMPLEAAWAAFDGGAVGEAARARVTHVRALERLGYVPALRAWLDDLPAGVREAWTPLGLPAPLGRGALPPAPPLPEASPAPAGLAAGVDGVHLEVERAIDLGGGARFVVARAEHRAGARAVGTAFPIQFLDLPYDRLKLVVWAEDPRRGPVVLLEPRARDALLVRALALGAEVEGAPAIPAEAPDVIDLPVAVRGAAPLARRLEAAAAAALAARGLEAAPAWLGAASDASPGQSSLRHHFLAARVPAAVVDARFLPLALALVALRTGGGEAATEAALTRLADRLRWIPALGRRADDPSLRGR
jgi:hypothetical protein